MMPLTLTPGDASAIDAVTSPAGARAPTPKGGKRSRLAKWRQRIILAGALLVASFFAAVFFAPSLLVVDSGEVQADVIVVLGGGSGERPARAAALFQERAAPLVLVTGYGDCESNTHLLNQAGVPATALIAECNSHSTKQNAQFSGNQLRSHGVHRVILVTSWYHSRRALACFRHFAPGFEYYSRPAYFGLERREWSRTGVGRYVRAEFLKTIGYWVCYGVWPT